jgi:hypothetical protein
MAHNGDVLSLLSLPDASRGLSYLSHSADAGGVDGVTGLYTVGGLEGLPTGLTFAFLGFFFSLRRASRLPMFFPSSWPFAFQNIF